MRKWEWDFNRELLSCVRIHGLSLPFLYLSILSHFISMVHINLNESELYPEMYRRFVFEVDKTTDKPLGIYDPLKTIHSLINTLNILWTAGPHNRIREFKSFRLRGFNILQGKRELDNNWKTLVAYCGGWKLNDDNGTFLKCGEYPLVLGKSDQCKVCGHLICPTCGFCSTDCQPNPKRVSMESEDRKQIG
jgi:hypothetical protein